MSEEQVYIEEKAKLQSEIDRLRTERNDWVVKASELVVLCDEMTDALEAWERAEVKTGAILQSHGDLEATG